MPQGAANIVTTLIPVAKVKEVMDRLKGREDTDDKVRCGVEGNGNGRGWGECFMLGPPSVRPCCLAG